MAAPHRSGLWLFVALLLVPASAMITWAVTGWRSPEVVWKSCEPPPPSDKPSPSYCAFVMHVTTRHRFPFFEADREYELWISREAHAPSYGHPTRMSLHAGFGVESEWLERSRGRWDERGFTFEEPSGHHLFVPRAAFVGGR